MSYSRIKSSLLIASLAALSACGGGSSDMTGTRYPLDLAISDFYQMPHAYTLHASSGGDAYMLNINIRPGSQGNFQGVQAMTAILDASETKNGAQAGGNSQEMFFVTTPYTELGTDIATGIVLVDSAQQVLPEFAAVGSSGSLDSQKYYSDSTLGTQIATGTRAWSLKALTSDTAQFCILDKDDLGGNPETEVDCYDMDIKGNITALQITVTSGGKTLAFK